MKKTITPKTVARALSFPDLIEIEYYPVANLESWWGPGTYTDTKGLITWQEVKLRFGLGETYAAECVGVFPAGNRRDRSRTKGLERDRLEAGDPGYDKPPVSEP